MCQPADLTHIPSGRDGNAAAARIPCTIATEVTP